MKIASITSEAAPLAKSGGLGDAVSALAIALSRKGHDVRLVMPFYGEMDSVAARLKKTTVQVRANHGKRQRALRVWEGQLPESRVRLYALEAPALFARKGIYVRQGKEFKDNLERFSALCQGALNLFPRLDWQPDIIHCHDWISSLTAVHLAHGSQSEELFYRRSASVLTIHNLAYQGTYPLGQWPVTGLAKRRSTRNVLEWKRKVNCLRAGLLSATRLTAVSPTYAREILTKEQGCGLNRLLTQRRNALTGILNGIDQNVWNPATDLYLPARYSVKDLSGKQRCRKSLRRLFKLPDNDSLVVGMVQRIVEQKGMEVLLEAAEELLCLPIQLVVLGTGEPRYENPLKRLSRKYPKRLAVRIAFDEKLAHQIEAGADAFFMPSRFEPCGLNQLYSLRYGTVPVVRRTGGLADTVCHATPRTIAQREATGITFEGYSGKALVLAMKQAVRLFNQPRIWTQLMRTGMKQDFSWERSASAYVRVYRQALKEHAKVIGKSS